MISPAQNASVIAARLDDLRYRVDRAALRAGREPGSVRIVAISKTFHPQDIQAARQAGQVDFGENRAQELRRKAIAMKTLAGDEGLRWHFVGRLQRNKVRDVVGLATLIHSVDRVEVARAVADRARRIGSVQQVLVQVNIGNDPAKGGCRPDEALTLVEHVRDLEGITCQGLMTVPALEVDPRPFFGRLRELRDVARDRWPEVQHLSMGMSKDFEVAVEEGATIVRLGEAIFGSRSARP
ncbi:MAG: YggS family pyridoxal phosphate-dependent enzyme [Egibacteraceae bacterium]